jgi:predicted small lipoprotein YifL
MRLKTLWFPIILLALAGCGGEDGIELEKGPFLFPDRTQLQFDTEFGSGTYVGASTFNTLMIENRGDEPLEITEVIRTGPSEFIVTPPEGLTASTPVRLESLKRAYVQVQFKPTQAKDYTGKLTIKSNSKDGAEKVVELIAKGVRAP